MKLISKNFIFGTTVAQFGVRTNNSTLTLTMCCWQKVQRAWLTKTKFGQLECPQKHEIQVGQDYKVGLPMGRGQRDITLAVGKDFAAPVRR